MSFDRDERTRRQDRYLRFGADPMMAAEREVLGSDYQANGYTTRNQADRIGDLLALTPAMTLLDLGSGCGWPGLYLAARHGCRVVSVDPVEAGATTARDRAKADGMTVTAWSVVGDAADLPLRSGSVDAVIHTDVMC